MPHSPSKPLRLLVVCPSWLGDVVMATPALRLLRTSLPGSFIGALVRPGLDELLAGSDFFDEIHVDRARGVMGPKIVAAKLRPRRYDAALLLTNSFSTALIARLAFIPRRVGYERDGRGMLLTDRLHAPRRARPHKGWAPIPAVDYYLHAAGVLLGEPPVPSAAPPAHRLELGITLAQHEAADAILTRAGLPPTARFAILNPGGNNPAKRWPPDRYALLGTHLIRRHNLHILINGSPGEVDVVRAVADGIRALLQSSPTPHIVAELPSLGMTIGSLKGVTKHAAIMVTNDTGPRHIAAAFGIPTIALFGPTDPRWTTLPDSSAEPGARERIILADPTLPVEEVADDHPERCRVDRIETDAVLRAVDDMLG